MLKCESKNTILNTMPTMKLCIKNVNENSVSNRKKIKLVA